MSTVINKSEFIADLAESCERFDQKLVDVSVRELLDLMSNALVEDDRIEVRGFGSFSLHHRKSRVGRNPRTGEQVSVAAKAIPHFKPGKALKEAVDNAS